MITMGVLIAIMALLAFFAAPLQNLSFAASMAFNDLPPDAPVYPYVKYLAGKNFITGYPDGSFRPGAPLSRAEMAALLAKAGALTGRNPATPTFCDVPRHHWAYALVEAATAAGLVKGELDGTFRPEAPVTRAEAAAFLLRLTGAPLPTVPLPGTVRDIDANHWARHQVAAALDAGLLLPAADNHFAPDVPATRAEVARCLTMMLNIRPENMAVPLPIILTPLAGKVMLKELDGEFIKITADTRCGKGATIKTAAGGRAELRFPDGSGLMLEENTTLTVKKVLGQATAWTDGSERAVLDCLEIDLCTGRIFGFAAVYRQTGTATAPPVLNTTTDRPEDTIESTPWWRQVSAARSRVCVNMPWSTAEIKGTLWMNEVRPDRQTTNVINGLVRVTAAGHAANVLAGQTTAVHAPATPPAQPVHLPVAEQVIWREAKQWVYQRAEAIRNISPLILPPGPITGQKSPATFFQAPADEIIKSFNLAISGATGARPPGSSRSHGRGSSDRNTYDPPQDTVPPGITGVEPKIGAANVPNDQIIIVTFSENVRAGSAYDDIMLQDAAGNALPLDKSLDGQTMILTPVYGIYCSAPVSGVITITFDLALREAENLAVQLLEGGTAARTIYGRVRDCQLTVPYSDLKYSTVYTVHIPPGSLQSKDYATGNEEICWSFTTMPAPDAGP